MSDTFPRNLSTSGVPDWQLHAERDVESVHSSITHDWGVDGWTPFRRVVINIDTPTDFSDSIVTGRGRITGVGTPGNRREWRLHNDAFFTDSEVRSLWWGGSVWDNAISLPQLGHVHRAQEVSPGVWKGWVVTNNIFLSSQNTINQNIWQGNGGENSGGGLTLGSNGGSKVFSLSRTLRIIGVDRLNFGGWINRYSIMPAHAYGMAAGDPIATASLDATFTETSALVSSVDTVAGLVVIPEAVTQSSVAFKLDTGSVAPTGAKLYWPHWVASRLIGNLLTVKVWRHLDPEPDWGDSNFIKFFDTSVTNPGSGQGGTPAPSISEPTSGPGYCGLAAAHLRNNAYLEFGQLQIKRL